MRLTADGFRDAVDAAEAEEARNEAVRRANIVAARAGYPFLCTGCGGMLRSCLITEPDTADRIERRSYAPQWCSCHDRTHAQQELEAVRLNHSRMLRAAGRLRDARAGANEHFLRCVGVGLAANAFFRRFVPQSESQQAALDLAEHFNGKPWCLALSGERGTGKSHLMAARFRRSLRLAVRMGRPLPLFSTEVEIFDRWRRASVYAGPGAAENCLVELMNLRVLYIDDLGTMSMARIDWLRALERLLECRHRHRRPTFITTDLNRAQLTCGYGKRVASLFESAAWATM